ncbi:chloroplastic group iia intron splicing facilitator crs1 chloroplastic [Phtheirospermum japonicum]|uniref:Chloroplastic group iia intron splicing facilitator crs1 chloroplastic n=1 Tax=Phtheirospermum japonicum TaxID=374723 RepID=A0A830CGU0_9LAMI|nr:chloroplastic group iia intron splicing facilitator crs1 chloroplastic [Phtheirospermum japonicum]
MAAKLTELQPHLLSTFSLPRRKPPHFPLQFFKPFSSSLRSTNVPKTPSRNPNTPENSSTWIKKWPSPPPKPPPLPKPASRKPEPKTETVRAGTTAIDRIVLRLRNLGLGSDDEEDLGGELGISSESASLNFTDSRNVEFGDEKLGDLLKRDWVRPDTILLEDEDRDSDALLPWERGVDEDDEMEKDRVGVKKRDMRAPSLAELTIEDEELRRLRRMGMTLRERINVPKAGITGAILEKIHDKWRKNELVRLKFHEELAHDMKTAHEIVERRTGGLVTWRSGSVMIVFRGTNYEGPISKSQKVNAEEDALFVPNVTFPDNSVTKDGDNKNQVLEKPNPVVPVHVKITTEEEAEYNSLLDGLGPRFEDWWGTGVLPVDADLLPPTIPGYKTPFRLLATGMRSRLTNAEMTNLRKLAKSLPCHFALGRNRNHQGLAKSIVKLWEKSLLVKIAVKRGIQNTNNKIMAEELKKLTGGVLLLRNKYYIVMYRGKDFLPPGVTTVLAERQEMAKQVQDVEEKVRVGPAAAAAAAATATPLAEEKEAQAGTLAEFYEAQARWGIDITAEDRERMIEEASRAKRAKVIRRLEHKVALSQAKKQKAEKLLSKIVDSWVPVDPSDDQETITDEERVMYRKVGLRMKAYLPLGIRGVFDGVIENMHLHWKHRELVKLISKEKELSFVEETARLLEYESGGILVAIERVTKGHALIYYRGKNYRRPITLRPRNLLTKAKALKRRVALQRYEALSQHISELEKTIEQTKREIGNPEKLENGKHWNSGDHGQLNNVSELDESEDDEAFSDEDEEGSEWDDDDDDSEFPNL